MAPPARRPRPAHEHHPRAGASRADAPSERRGRREPPSGHRQPAAPAERRRDGEAPGRRRTAEPTLPGDVAPRDLDREARSELRSLPASLADKVACHLVTAGRLLDEDPRAAYDHAWYARGLAPRLAVVREAAGITAYRVGEYAAALAELRAVRRMTGDPSHLPIMADAERGLGRPDRALALARDPAVRQLDPAARVEMAIVASGARRDRGEYDAAVAGLQAAAVNTDRVEPWTVRLWYAYAEALLGAGRRDEAVRWFESAAAIDDDGQTDAADRVAELTA